MTAYLIETQRLRLRPLDCSDLDSLLEIFSDPETMKFYPSVKSTHETEQWIKRSKNLYEIEKIGFFALEFKENRQFTGECGLIPQTIEAVTKWNWATTSIKVTGEWDMPVKPPLLVAIMPSAFLD